MFESDLEGGAGVAGGDGVALVVEGGEGGGGGLEGAAHDVDVAGLGGAEGGRPQVHPLLLDGRHAEVREPGEEVWPGEVWPGTKKSMMMWSVG